MSTLTRPTIKFQHITGSTLDKTYAVFADDAYIGEVRKRAVRNAPTGRRRGPSTGPGFHYVWEAYDVDGKYIARDYTRRDAAESLYDLTRPPPPVTHRLTVTFDLYEAPSDDRALMSWEQFRNFVFRNTPANGTLLIQDSPNFTITGDNAYGRYAVTVVPVTEES